MPDGMLTVYLTTIENTGSRADISRAQSAAAAKLARRVARCCEELHHLPDGKPYFPSMPQLCISISHTGDFAAVSAEGFAHGIDIEALCRSISPKLAQRFFTQGERQWTEQAVGDGDWQRRMLTVWTRKEAVIKAAGCSLSDISRLDTCPNGQPESVITVNNARWYMYSDTITEQKLILSVCSRQEVLVQTIYENN